MDDISRPEVGEVRGERWAIYRITHAEHCRTMPMRTYKIALGIYIEVEIVSRRIRSARDKSKLSY